VTQNAPIARFVSTLHNTSVGLLLAFDDGYVYLYSNISYGGIDVGDCTTERVPLAKGDFLDNIFPCEVGFLAPFHL
jgi:hypothetical protein